MIVSLEVKSGPSAGKGVRLQSGQSIQIGRTQQSDFMIPGDSHISSVHFAIELEENSCRLRDLNSRNGTLLNGQRVDAAVVQSGDTIVAGETAFAVIVYHDTPTPLPVDAAPELGPTATPQERLLALLRNDYQPLYAILDAARDIRIMALLMQSKEEYQSLYEGVQGAKLSQVAPYLVKLGRDSLLLGSLLLEGWGKSWGVYLTCTSEFPDVRRHLRRFLEVQLPDGKQVYFRFYDPRVLRVYLPTCTAEETNQFFGSIKQYLMEGEKPDELLEFANAGNRTDRKVIDLSSLAVREARRPPSSPGAPTLIG
jgi:hypothetical protein